MSATPTTMSKKRSGRDSLGVCERESGYYYLYFTRMLTICQRVCLPATGDSFTSKIAHLQAENERLENAVNSSKSEAAAEFERSHQAEEEVAHLKLTADALQAENHRLRMTTQKCWMMTTFFKKKASKSAQGVNEVFSLVEKLKAELLSQFHIPILHAD